MARKHWTQLSQVRRPQGKSINDDGGGTWARGGREWHISDSGSGGFQFLGFTDPKTGIRRGIFGANEDYKEELVRLGFKRVKFNASIRDRDVKRDYKFNQFTMKQGKIFNRPVYRVKKS